MTRNHIGDRHLLPVQNQIGMKYQRYMIELAMRNIYTAKKRIDSHVSVLATDTSYLPKYTRGTAQQRYGDRYQLSAEIYQKDCDVGGRNAGDARCLRKCARLVALELDAAFHTERSNLRGIEISGELDVLQTQYLVC